MKNGGTEKPGSAMYHDYISDSILRFPAFTPAGNAGYFFYYKPWDSSFILCFSV